MNREPFRSRDLLSTLRLHDDIKTIMARAMMCGLLVASLTVLARAQQTPGKSASSPTVAQSPEMQNMRAEAERLFQGQLFKESLDVYKKLLIDPASRGEVAASDLRAAIDCQQRLGIRGDIDGILAESLAVRPDDWRFLTQAARSLLQAPHTGAIVNEKFLREPRSLRTNTRWINSTEQDRQQALQWLEKALRLCGELPTDNQPASEDIGSSEDRGRVWQTMVDALLLNRQSSAWHLLSKTSMEQAPNYTGEDENQYFAYDSRYASVDDQGQPLFWKLPTSWNAATSDAERLRWAVDRVGKIDAPQAASGTKYTFASFLNSLFSVETLLDPALTMHYAFKNMERSKDIDKASETAEAENVADELSGMLAVHTLGENETIAKIASGIKRFELPDDLNPIRLFQQVAAANQSSSQPAHNALVHIFLTRRQYSKAASLLEEHIKRYGDPHKHEQQRLDDIVKPRGTFDPVPAQPAGKPPRLTFLYRNAKKAEFTARPVKLEELIRAIKNAYRNGQIAFEGKPNNFPPNPELPMELFTKLEADRYLEPPVATWSMDLELREDHWDKQVNTSVPIEKGGLYLIECRLNGDEHLSRILLWINDLAIVRKPIADAQLIYVADAITSQPLSNVNVEFFGVTPGDRNPPVNMAKKTDNDGQIILRNEISGSLPHSNYQWMVIARDARGRIAVQGNGYYSYAPMSADRFRYFKAFGVADQPVHRPGDKIKAHFWVATTGYDPKTTAAPFANRQCTVKLQDPLNATFFEKEVRTDAQGALDLEIDLPKTAKLGVYRFQIQVGKNFVETELGVRVEEFRKPEFEVKIEAPDKPVQLGEKFEATVEARYYFGSPVSDADVNVKVTRTAYNDDWYPIRPFDWCYGRGYWWMAYDYDWYPNWYLWRGCSMPPRLYLPNWFGGSPSEVVLEQSVQLDADGRAKITIDSALAAKMFSKNDHRYTISAQVRDASRRTLSATGEVIASRQPFKVYTWLDRGHYRVGEMVEANFIAQTLSHKPVKGTGKLELLRITYDDKRKPSETVVESWDVNVNEDGQASQKFAARRGGQYRLRLTVKDEAGRAVEGAYIFTIRGDAQGADNFRFTELELIPDKPEYAIGDQVQLQINADRADATVLVFVRAANGVAPAPRVIKLDKKTTTITIPVLASDQPNFFVEAFTIFDGKFYSAMREIFVPPVESTLDVKIQADKEEYLPGQKGKVNIQAKGLDGKSVSGSLVVAIYDRALEQIAADVLPRDIREFFWKWRRNHYPQQYETLSRTLMAINIENVPPHTLLSPFDAMLAGIGESGVTMFADFTGRGGMMGGMGGMMGGMGDMGAMARGGMVMEAAGGFGGGMPGASPMAMAPASKAASGMLSAVAASGVDENNLAATTVRKDFADSVLWLANVKLDARGQAQSDFTMPENLTDWQMRTWVVGPKLQVGSGKTTAVTRKHILIRIAAPRFLTERDEVVVSAIVQNDFDTPQDVRVRFEIDGETQLQLLDSKTAVQTISLAAKQQKRIDYRCKALAEGEVTLRAFAESKLESDAMQVKLPIIVNGTLKTESFAGTVRADQTKSTATIHIPQQRRADQSELIVRMSPSLAMAMVDALPYLAEYPYGCTEQTLNRFLPSVITQRFLKEMKVDLEQVKNRRNNLNAQEIGGPERGSGWRRFDANPVFDQATLEDMVNDGVQKLTDIQQADGGWGWFFHLRSDASTPHTTAVVVRGLLIARENGVAIVPDVLARGIARLEQFQNEALAELQAKDAEKAAEKADAKSGPSSRIHRREVSNLDAFIFHTLVLADKRNDAMQQKLFDGREHLSVYGKALLAWATHKLGNREQTETLRRIIEQFLVQDAENETAYVRDESPWWYWYGSEIESNAIYLKLLAAQDPKSPTAQRVVKYLLNNRKHATYWNSTRDTALVVEAFGDYLKASGETNRTVSAEVLLDGKRLGTVSFTPQIYSLRKRRFESQAMQFQRANIRSKSDVKAMVHCTTTSTQRCLLKRKRLRPPVWKLRSTGATFIWNRSPRIQSCPMIDRRPSMQKHQASNVLASTMSPCCPVVRSWKLNWTSTARTITST